MNDIEVSSIDLVEGGNVFKQGHYLTLGYVPRDENGETVDLSGKTLNVALWGRKGVVFEASATFSGGVIRFTLDKTVPAAEDYTVEFTATSSTDAKYRKKFPANSNAARIAIKQSADDLGVIGISVYTVAQFQQLFDEAVGAVTEDSEVILARDGESLLGTRLDKDKQELTLQLADKVGNGTKAEPEDLSERSLALVTGQGTVNLLSIPQDGSVTPKKTTLFTYSRNLFNLNDPDTTVDGYYTSTGTWTPHSSRRQTGFIEVTEGQPITDNRKSLNMYWYDADKVFIEMTRVADFQALGYLNPPAGAKFARFLFDSIAQSTYQIEYGTVSTEYQPYFVKLINNLLLSDTQRSEVLSIVENGVQTFKPYQNKRILYLGDSITAIGDNERGWIRYLNEKLTPQSHTNLAVSGATWADIEGTVYDGNPVQSVAANNVLGNQVQKLLNGSFGTFDIIIIAAGTNDGTTAEETDVQIEQQFFASGANVPLANVDRKTFAGAIRYAVEKLREAQPSAQIFLTTPLQRANDHAVVNRYLQIKNKGTTIHRMGAHMSVPVLEVMEESGIYGQNGIDNTVTLDFNDGLHLSPTGAKKFGYYVARKLMNWFVF